MEKMNKNPENQEKGISKWDLIDQIVDFELKMFLEVKSNTEGKNSPCQEEPETFKIMRWMSHSVLNETTIKSYLEDLISASVAGRNLMTEKYALMEKLIPEINNNPVIEKIAEIEINWMNVLKPQYPNLLQNNSDAFRNYMVCEYQTYSDETLGFLMNDLNTALDKGLNLVELRYKNLFKRLGYNSLEELEQSCKK